MISVLLSSGSAYRAFSCVELRPTPRRVSHAAPRTGLRGCPLLQLTAALLGCWQEGLLARQMLQLVRSQRRERQSEREERRGGETRAASSAALTRV